MPKMSPIPADLIGDLEVLEGVLDLMLRKLTLLYCQFGLRVRVGCETGAVQR